MVTRTMAIEEKSANAVTNGTEAGAPTSRPNDERYDAQTVEKKWFERWQQDASLYAAEPNSTKKKYYVLEMLPYPSGALHMGHVRNYSIGDALARYMWMNGYNVLHPMGWDSFGLPAENAAISNNTPPREWTLRNIANMKAQMKRIGFAYDWSREVTTCLPDYYRWNQWFFLKLYEQGLVYRKKSKVNWCPKCATVLANEQVVNGCCWRHEDTQVEQRELEQWFVRTTKYAEELLRDLDRLEGWPEKVRTMQRNWIGRSEGALVDFQLEGNAGPAGSKISVFTTRIDTIFGATSLQLAPEHPLVADFTRYNQPLGAVGRAIDRRAAQSQRNRRHRRDRKARREHAPLRHQSVQRRADSDLDCQLHPDGLRHGRHHERARARRARLRFRQEVQTRDPPCDSSRRQRSGRDHGRTPVTVHHARRHGDQLGPVQRHRVAPKPSRR